MENNNKTQMIAGAIVLVVVLGLLIGAKKGNDTRATDVSDTGSTTESVSTEVKTPVVETTVKTTTVYKKPVGNIVELTAKGFAPFVLEIKRGESVEFLNGSNKTMVIRSSDKKPENFYPGFAQTGAPLGKGGKFYFGFTTPGAWAYYNLNSPADQGVIIVK